MIRNFLLGGSMEKKLVYRPLAVHSDDEIKRILSERTLEEITLLPLEVGMNHHNWKFAQDVCLKLAEHENEAIRANTVLGLAYIARTKGKLSYHLVKPVIFRELRRSENFKWRIEDAICDINIFLDWNLAFRHKI